MTSFRRSSARFYGLLQGRRSENSLYLYDLHQESRDGKLKMAFLDLLSEMSKCPM